VPAFARQRFRPLRGIARQREGTLQPFAVEEAAFRRRIAYVEDERVLSFDFRVSRFDWRTWRLAVWRSFG
jgi:hypothetical protein